MKYKTLMGDQCFFMIPPNIQAMMTGVKNAAQNKDGIIRLTYSDNTEESADCKDIDITTFENFLSIVGLVQDRARKSKS